MKLRAVLVGAGSVGAGMASDPRMAKYYPYATHAQVLAAHPEYEWVGVVDSDARRLEEVSARWGVTARGARLGDLAGARPEVIVIATPPRARDELFRSMPESVRGVLLEKPIADTPETARAIEEDAQRRGLCVAVNYWRRADAGFRALASGELERRIGRAQGATLYYGNGLLNNGSHLVDFARMLLGEVDRACALGEEVRAGPIAGDVQFPFYLRAGGVPVFGQPLDFAHYRENGIEVWGTRGRLSILVEGLSLAAYACVESRSTTGAREVASDAPETLASTVGDAFYEMYSDLARAVRGGSAPCSPLGSALRTEAVIDALMRSLREPGVVKLAG